MRGRDIRVYGALTTNVVTTTNITTSPNSMMITNTVTVTNVIANTNVAMSAFSSWGADRRRKNQT